jgi:ELMO/CED-12 family
VKYPLKAQAMLNANKLNTKTNYPFAIVGINITLLLAELLNLRDQRYERKCSIMHVFAVIHSC